MVPISNFPDWSPFEKDNSASREINSNENEYNAGTGVWSPAKGASTMITKKIVQEHARTISTTMT